jgi:hypothetical protein
MWGGLCCITASSSAHDCAIRAELVADFNQRDKSDSNNKLPDQLNADMAIEKSKREEAGEQK